VHSGARVAGRVIVPRALVVWGLSRLIFAAVQLSAGMSPAAYPPPPVAVALVAGLLGLLDVRVRGESVLWANLGVGSGLLFLLYVATAIPGEVLLALVTR
jgi:hypothetical protein